MIDNFDLGRITVRGIEYTSDVIIFADRVDGSWWRKEAHSLCIEDIESVVKDEPEVVIVGTGVNGLMRVPQQTRDFVSGMPARLIVERTDKACEMYNQVCGNSKVVAALHLTC